MTYYPINEDTAKRANDANSFRDYKPGSATAAYRAEVDKAAALVEKQKGKVDPMHHDKLDGLLDRYAHRLADYYNDYYRNEAACPSILITGGANFPVAKKEKQNARRDTLLILSFRVNVSSLTFSNTSVPKVGLVEPEKVIFFNPLSPKALNLISVTLDGITTDVRFLQFRKAASAMLVWSSAIVTL